MIELVNIINGSIAQQTGLNEGSMNLFGIAEPVIIRDVEDTLIPVVIDPDGECHDVLLDDAFDVSLYHRLNTKSYTTMRNDGYGGEPKRFCVYDMTMYVSGKRRAIDLYRLERICVAAIEGACKGSRNASSEAVQTDFNRIRVFSSEYSGLSFPMQPDVFLFKISYKLTRVQSPC